MMRRGLQPGDLGDLLERPLVAVLATSRPDGEVLLSPVWHEWRDGGFTVASSMADVKVRHLRKEPRASMLVYESVPPYRGIEVRGRAELVREDVGEVAERIAIRYLGLERGTAYAAGAADDVVIRVVPGVLRAWDFADDFGGASEA